MDRLLPLSDLLSVLIRGVVLSFQSLTLGGIAFLFFVIPSEAQRSEVIGRSTLQWIKRWALALAAAQAAYVLLDMFVLMRSAGFTLAEVIGANFVLAGALSVTASLAIVILATARSSIRRMDLLLPAIFILAASAMTSHAVSRLENRYPLVLLTAAHQAATAAWIGGLPFLLIALRHPLGERIAQSVCGRFSRLAQISVAVLAVAGFALAYVYIGNWHAALGSTYAIMVGGKVVLFGILLLLGALNFRIAGLPRTANTWFLTSLRCFGEAEIGIGFSVILLAASLTSLPPAVDTQDDNMPTTAIGARLMPHWPPAVAPPFQTTADAGNQALLAAVAPRTLLADSSARSVLPDTSDTAEYDEPWMDDAHHWAALVVLTVGFMAFLARTGRAAWARNWPLLFPGLGLVLLLMSDGQYWPRGPYNFWSSFIDPIVLPHRIIEILIAIFGIFEWRVQTQRLTSPRACLIFPILVALCSSLLLAHIHSTGDLQVPPEVLQEFSHISMAIFGLVAGWSRWLELRLPSRDRSQRVMSWIWPACFLLVGVTLALYRGS